METVEVLLGGKTRQAYVLLQNTARALLLIPETKKHLAHVIIAYRCAGVDREHTGGYVEVKDSHVVLEEGFDMNHFATIMALGL